MVELSRWKQMTNLNACMFKTQCRTEQMTDKKVDWACMFNSDAQSTPPECKKPECRHSLHVIPCRWSCVVLPHTLAQVKGEPWMQLA